MQLHVVLPCQQLLVCPVVFSFQGGFGMWILLTGMALYVPVWPCSHIFFRASQSILQPRHMSFYLCLGHLCFWLLCRLRPLYCPAAISTSYSYPALAGFFAFLTLCASPQRFFDHLLHTFRNMRFCVFAFCYTWA